MTSKTVRSFGFLSVCPARCDQVADRGNSPVRCNPAPRQFVVFSSRPGLKGFSRHKKRGDIRCAHPIEKSPHFSIVSRPISTFSLCASRVVRPCQEKKNHGTLLENLSYCSYSHVISLNRARSPPSPRVSASTY